MRYLIGLLILTGCTSNKSNLCITGYKACGIVHNTIIDQDLLVCCPVENK